MARSGLYWEKIPTHAEIGGNLDKKAFLRIGTKRISISRERNNHRSHTNPWHHEEETSGKRQTQ